MKKESAIRPAASEHFYEDFGNNLTRIQVLSVMLERKIFSGRDCDTPFDF
jgi:hypothetical protein